jgi:hypothetical protein
MASFDVPLLPDPGYAALLQEHADRIHSVFFSLHSPEFPDGRPRAPSFAREELSDVLRTLRGPRKFALLNSRFHCPGSYADPEFLDSLLATLERFKERCGLTGIVYTDHYLLQALSDRSPGLSAELEAAPSINCRLGSARSIAMHMEYIDGTSFCRPGRILLDRSYNRDLSGLERLSGRIRTAWPEMRVGLLANEGCLPFCPFSGAHESHIALSHLSCGSERSAVTNRDLGCSRYFLRDPAHILRSPFIRPEDVELYEPHADVIKLCGRTRGANVMRRIVEAYLARSFQGNLLELMDSMEHLAARLELPNEAVPADFARRVSTCSGICEDCGYCGDLASSVVRDKGPLHIKRMWA